MLQQRYLTEQIIRLAIDVHRALGPGLLESLYSSCLCLELQNAAIPFEREVAVPINYRGVIMPLGFRADVVVADAVILEIKAVGALLPIHDAQILTYLRMSGIHVGLLMNFHAPRLVEGLRRFVV